MDLPPCWNKELLKSAKYTSLNFPSESGDWNNEVMFYSTIFNQLIKNVNHKHLKCFHMNIVVESRSGVLTQHPWTKQACWWLCPRWWGPSAGFQDRQRSGCAGDTKDNTLIITMWHNVSYGLADDTFSAVWTDTSLCTSPGSDTS